MIGKKYCPKDSLKLSLLVINQVDDSHFLALLYKKIIDIRCIVHQVLSDGVIISKAELEQAYVEFDSPLYHEIMQQIEQEAKDFLNQSLLDKKATYD